LPVLQTEVYHTMSEFKKFIFPGVLTILGIVLLINGGMTEQNGMFMFGAVGILIAGIVGLAAAAVELNKMLRLGVSGALILLVAGLAYSNYQSIKVPIEFQNEKERRYEHVVQRLKDIRTAELAYKARYQKYMGNMDSLVDFIKSDSIAFIKAIGNVPDTMSLEDAVKAGIVSRDTLYVSVYDSLFATQVTADRVHAFVADSIAYVPFTGGAEFALDAGFVKRSSVDVPVFQATDSKPFDKRDVLQVGSMNDPKTNGNWE